MNVGNGSAAMNMGGMNFDSLLESALRVRSAEAEAPAGMVQRLQARLALEAGRRKAVSPVRPFAFAESVKTQRSAASIWTAVAAHAAVLLLVLTLALVHPELTAVKQATTVSTLLPPPPLPRSPTSIAGGGGAHDAAPAMKGRLPPLAQHQIVPPKAPPMIAAQLTIEPTVVVQKDLKMATNDMPNLGMPNAPASAIGSLGNGNGGGIGSGNGNGIGAGDGGNTGGGVYTVGGSVKAPAVLYAEEAVYSEEARKAKFDGNVLVSLIVDEHGLPTHVHVVRGVGMGLDETAMAAVRGYRFRPATKDGKPVKVQLNIEVNYQIF